MTAASALITAIGGLIATLGTIGLAFFNMRVSVKRDAVRAGRKAQVDLLTQLLVNKTPTSDDMIQDLLKKMGGEPDEHT
jgi:hypothetical protein